MGGSSNAPNICEVIPRTEDKIRHLDHIVTEFLEFDFPDIHGLSRRDKRYEIIISSLKTLSSFMDLTRKRDEVLQRYNQEAKTPKLKILMTKGLLRKRKEYREILQRANSDLKTSWEKVLTTLHKNILPQTKNLQKDVCDCISSCRRYIVNFKDYEISHICKDPVIYICIRNEILFMLEYTLAGINELTRQLEVIEQPSISSQNGRGGVKIFERSIPGHS